MMRKLLNFEHDFMRLLMSIFGSGFGLRAAQTLYNLADSDKQQKNSEHTPKEVIAEAHGNEGAENRTQTAGGAYDCRGGRIDIFVF